MNIFITEENGEQRKIGSLSDKDKQVFYKTMSFSKHLYKKLDAIGIDAQYFKEQMVGKVRQIRVKDQDKNIIYSVDTNLYDEKGIYLHFKPHRSQIFLPRKWWYKKYKKYEIPKIQ